MVGVMRQVSLTGQVPVVSRVHLLSHWDLPCRRFRLRSTSFQLGFGTCHLDRDAAARNRARVHRKGWGFVEAGTPEIPTSCGCSVTREHLHMHHSYNVNQWQQGDFDVHLASRSIANSRWIQTTYSE
jgi:hypothetical protein